MVQDVRVQKIFEFLFAPENVKEISRGNLYSCLNKVKNLILNIKYKIPGV
jgi:hypothetical protein